MQLQRKQPSMFHHVNSIPFNYGLWFHSFLPTQFNFFPCTGRWVQVQPPWVLLFKKNVKVILNFKLGFFARTISAAGTVRPKNKINSWLICIERPPAFLTIFKQACNYRVQQVVLHSLNNFSIRQSYITNAKSIKIK